MNPALTPSKPRAVALAVVCALPLFSCSSSTPKQAIETEAGSDYKIVSDADVTAGLTKISAIAATLEARRKANETDARAGLDELYKEWYAMEGTVRKNEKAIYLDLEDALVSVKIGVQENKPEKIASGVTLFETARTAYIAKRP